MNIGFNFLSHGSQDLYPTYLKDSKGFDDYHAIVATIIGNIGAIMCVSHFYLQLMDPPIHFHFHFFPAAAPSPVPYRSTSAAG
jgi:hypothetical protein